jgi:cytoskeletal protein CcmA (bactofilin family)
LPKIEKECFDGLLFFCRGYQPVKSQLTIYETTNKKIINSFKEKTKNMYSSLPITLEKTEISGNIIIKSDTIIKIKKTALLRDVILIAPSIEIEDQVTGNFQSIASKNIKVGKECKLSYPSALILIQDNKDKPNATNTKPFENQIFIDTKTTIKGSICYLQTKELPDFNTQVVLEKESRIKGQVYCQGNFELKGCVSGCVFTKQFISNTAGSIFVNHIFNGTIENENIPSLYGGIVLEKEKKTILKWLY